MTEDDNSLPALMAGGSSIAWPCLLRRHAHLQADFPALRFAGATTTYGELDATIDRAAGALHTLGVRPGDRVAILTGNTPAFVHVFGGALRLGAIAVPINFRLVAAEIAFVLDDSGANVVVADSERADAARSAAAEADHDVAVRITGPDGAGSWDVAIAVAAAMPPPPDDATFDATFERWRPESPALITYTSGTTGRPKGAVLTHLNLLVQTMTRMHTIGLRGAGDVGLAGSPLFHIAGLVQLVPALIVGATVVLAPTGSFDPAAMLDLIESERLTSVSLVPTQWQALCERPDIAERDLHVTSMSWGASPALPSTLEAMGEAFPGISNIAVFGQSEMSSVTCALDGADATTRVGSVGKPVPTVDIRIVDEDMHDVTPGTIGEIVYRSPATMVGYWNNPDGTADALRGGWFHSGDLVRVDDDGFLWVVDRKKDMIISGGENIYSSEVEHAIDGHPKIREVAVVGGPHPRWVETPVAFVVPTDPADPPTVEEVVARATDRLASYKKPTRVEIVDSLPRNASGKVLKTELRRRLAAPDS